MTARTATAAMMQTVLRRLKTAPSGSASRFSNSLLQWQGAESQQPQQQPWALCCRTFSSAPLSTPTTDDDDYDEVDASTPNAFEILGVPERFDVNEVELKEKYRTLMNQNHPDRQRFADSSSLAVDASSITHAYDQISNPTTRAIHLLELLGKPLEESKQMQDMEFLMEVMEIRENVDQIIHDHCCCCGDHGAACDERLKPAWRENNQRIQDTCQALQAAFAAGDLDQALALTGKLQYWNRIEETIRDKLGNLD